VGSVTLCDSSRPAAHTPAPCQHVPNFGGSEIGFSQALQSLSAEHIETEEASPTDSPLPPAPVPAPSSQQDAAAALVVCSTITGSPSSKPVELQLAAGKEQGILSGDHPDDLNEDATAILALPRGPGRLPVLGFRSDQLQDR